MATADGLTARKSFALEPDGYILTFGAVVKKGDERLNPRIAWGPGLGDEIARAKPASFLAPSYNTPAQAIMTMTMPAITARPFIGELSRLISSFFKLAHRKRAPSRAIL